MANTKRVITWWIGVPNKFEAIESGRWAWMYYSEPRIDDEVEAFLWKSIREKHLEQQLQEAFQVTRPLWFGLWLDPPFSAARCSVLASLFMDIYTEEQADMAVKIKNVDAELEPTALQEKRDEFGYSEEEIADFVEFMGSLRAGYVVRLNPLRRFIASLEACALDNSPFYVEVSPPGHVDFGWYTIFHHCPRCKAHSTYSGDKEVPCTVCSYRYRPSATSSSTRVKPNRADTSQQ